MGALANIKASQNVDLSGYPNSNTLSASVAAEVTYEPEGQVALGVQRYVDRSSGIAAGYPSYTISVRRPQNGSRNSRIVEKVTLPVLNITSPSTGSGIQPLPSVAYNLVMNREFVVPEAASDAEKAKLLSLCASLFSRSVFASDGSPVDSTSAPIFDAVLKGIGPY